MFDAMALRFGEWEESSGAVKACLEAGGRKGRLGEILRGCLDGSRDERLHSALAVVYCDLGQLRAAGNIIFKVMRAAVGDRKELDVDEALRLRRASRPDRGLATVRAADSSENDSLMGERPDHESAAGTGLIAVEHGLSSQLQDWQAALNYLSDRHV